MQSIPAAPLPWQRCLLACICGLFACEHPEPAGLACLLVIVAFGRGLPQAACMLAAFGLGVGLGMPPARSAEPLRGLDGLVRGVVREVRTYPGRRITVVASDVADVGTGEVLPGSLAWTWIDPPSVPEAGERFEARLRIRGLRGRHNFGLASGEDVRLRQGVPYKAFSRGRAAVRWDSGGTSIRGAVMAAAGELTPAGQGGAVVRALLFGDRFDLDPAFMDRIRRAGLAHSLALSGMHLALVAGFGLVLAGAAARIRPQLLCVLPRQKLGLLMGLPLALCYMWLGGFTPSLLRAALMLAALALNMLKGERSLPQDTLCTAVAVLVLPNPDAVRDVGLQLSVLAVAGLALFMPHCAGLLERLGAGGRLRRLVHSVLTMAAVTVCANLFILPVQALYFYETPVHLWLNLLWLPVLGLAVLPLSFLGLAAIPVSEAVARACFFLAGMGGETLARGLAFLDNAGMLQAVGVLRPEGVQVVGYWAVLAASSALLASEKPAPKPLAFLGLGLLLMAGPPLREGLAIGRPGVDVTVLDTGMSQAVSVRGPSGRMVLVDGGGSWNSDYDPGRLIVAPALAWGRPPRLDAVVLSHVDADHSRGLLYILETFDVARFVWAGLLDRSADSLRLQELLERKMWPVSVVRAGDRIPIEADLWLDVLHPGPSERGTSGNETSLVLRLVWRGRGLALLPGDAELRAIDGVLRTGADLSADVLVLPHHGSRSSLRSDLYARVGAAWAVAACGPDNRFGFPHAEVVRACVAAGSEVLTTADRGAVRFHWEGAAPPLLRWARPAAGG